MTNQTFGNWVSEQIVIISKAAAYDAASKSADYWQKRCRAAERLLDAVDNNINKQFEGYTEWEQLKKDEFKPL